LPESTETFFPRFNFPLDYAHKSHYLSAEDFFFSRVFFPPLRDVFCFGNLTVITEGYKRFSTLLAKSRRPCHSLSLLLPRERKIDDFIIIWIFPISLSLSSSLG
jgi:hypothetical protein